MLKSSKLTILVLFILSLMALFTFLNMQNIDTKATTVDCSDGLDFITNCPTEKTEYVAGDGSITFIPATENTHASLILNNASINANIKVKYWSLNKTYVAFAYNNDIDITLIGENYIYLNPQYSCSGLLIYDGNVNISGDGKLSIGYNGEYKRSTAYPINIMGNYDVLNGIVEGNFKDSGNLTISDCNIDINIGTNRTTACIFSHNDITINSGNINLYNNTTSIQSNYSNIYINGGHINCIDFGRNGIYARYGDVNIDGNDTIVNLECAEDANYAMGIIAGNSSYQNDTEAGSVYIKGGKIDIKAGLVGVYAQRLDAKQDSGIIKISGGDLNIEVTLSKQILAGLYSEASETGVGGLVEIAGGKTVIKTKGSPTDASVGIYCVGDIVFSGGSFEAYANGTTPNTSIAVNSLSKIDILNDVKLLLVGQDCALNIAPNVSDNLEIISATDEMGVNVEDYNGAEIEKYKYINIKPIVKIESVDIVEKDVSIEAGESYQFSASVVGEGNFSSDVIWSISGNNSVNTVIDGSGLLTIGSDETAKEIIITATSAQDSSKSACITIPINYAENDSYIWIIIIIVFAIILVVAISTIVSIIIRKKKYNRF